MKMLKYISVIAMSLIFLSLVTLPAKAQDDIKYLGKVCYDLASGMGRPPYGGTLEVYSFGAGCIALSGMEDGGYSVNGTAFIGGDNTIIISLYGSSSSDSVKNFKFSQMTINAAAWSWIGTYTTLQIWTKTDQSPEIATLMGHVAFWVCK